MYRIDHWDCQMEKTEIEYEVSKLAEDTVTLDGEKEIKASIPADVNTIDKTDYIVAASCGLLTGFIDSFWVGEFSLEKAQEWGRNNANSFVIKVAKLRGCSKNDLESAIKFLEKDAPMASDKLMNVWGGALQHHFRDFAHHASIGGLFFSVLSQFTGLSYGTNTEGLFEIHELPDKSLLGTTFSEKLYNGIVIWSLHLVSDMAGSSKSAGRGTGIPGPILSLAKELSVLPVIRDFQINYKDKDVSLSVMLSKIFNGTAFEHTGYKDLKRFDLRTEIGISMHGTKQSVPVLINQCAVRAFYFVRRLCWEISSKGVSTVTEISNLNPQKFQPFNNKCILRMLTISSGIFCVVDLADATIRANFNKPESRQELVVNILLHANFIGIGNFVLSIKNDISENMCGDGIEQKEEMKARKIEDNYRSIETDVSVDVDSSGLYEYAFYRMYKHVKETKERALISSDTLREMQSSLFGMVDYETFVFENVASQSYPALVMETQKLIKRLFKFYKVEHVPLVGDSIYKYNTPFYRLENGKKIAYVFVSRMGQHVNWEEIRTAIKIDGIKAVALVEVVNKTETLDFIIDYEVRESRGFVQYITLKELFSLISNEEYDRYLKYLESYNKDIKKLLGYRTIIVPSEESLNALRIEVENELKNYELEKYLSSEGIYDGQIEIIRRNFLGRGLYKALLGNCSFAESFISSEWYYKTHIAMTALEQTAIIVGYLKSVEQLLFTIVKWSENTGRTIREKNKGKGNYILFSSENSKKVDTTLGSLIGYVRHYTDLWDVNNYVKNYIVNSLDVYRDKYRNDYFHKDNIYSVDEINEIRAKTIAIQILILGSMKIDEHKIALLGIETQTKIVDKRKSLVYEHVSSWLDRILGGDILLSTDLNIFFEVQSWGMLEPDQWKVEFETVTEYEEGKYPTNLSWPYMDDDLMWDSFGENIEEATQQFILMLHRYFEEGRYSKKLKTYKSVAVGQFGRKKIVYKR